MYGLHLSLYGDRKSLHFPSPVRLGSNRVIYPIEFIGGIERGTVLAVYVGGGWWPWRGEQHGG